MRNNLQIIKVPFPKNMMSTSRSEFNMSTNFAKNMQNMFIGYNSAGSKRNGFSKIEYSLPVDEIIVKLAHFPSSEGNTQIIAFTLSGKIFRRELTSDWEEIHSGMTESSDISTTIFADKLIICNGYDKMLCYDGISVSEIKQFISQKDFSFELSSNYSVKTNVFEENFPVNRIVKVIFDDNEEITTKVTQISESLDEGFIIIHFEDDIFRDGQTITDVQYQLDAPIFSRVYSAHDRLWAFGKGEFDLNHFSTDADRSRVFYTYLTNDEASWYDEEGNLCSINIADKMPETEELVAIGVKDNMTIFFCRNYSQVWGGTNPKLDGDFSWIKTIPIGLIHPNLVINMPNDIGFLSQFGARTFSRILQTEQLDIADMGSEVTSEIHNAIELARTDTNRHKNICSFQFYKQNWFGFKLGGRTLVFQVGNSHISWSSFDGLFEKSTAFLNTPDGCLYSISDNNFYMYDTNVFSDDGAPILTTWTTPWFSCSEAKYWANKYVEFIIEPSDLETAVFKRFKNYNSSVYSIKEINLKSLPDCFDVAFWDSAYFDSNYQGKAIIRDKFVASNISFSFQTNDTKGPLTIYAAKLYGSRQK